MLQRFPISAITMTCFSMACCSVLAATEKTEIVKSNSSDTVTEVIVVNGTL